MFGFSYGEMFHRYLLGNFLVAQKRPFPVGLPVTFLSIGGRKGKGLCLKPSNGAKKDRRGPVAYPFGEPVGFPFQVMSR